MCFDKDEYPVIDIQILVEGEQVPEHIQNEGIASIKVQSDARFTMKFQVEDRKKSDHISFFIYIDNQPVSSFSVGKEVEVDVVGGVILEKGIILPKEFKFSSHGGIILLAM